MGPVERAIRLHLRNAEVITVAEAVRRYGGTAAGVLARMLKRGVLERRGAELAPRVRAAPAPVLQRIEQRERQRFAPRQLERETERRQLVAEIAAAPDEEARRRLVREGQLLARVEHHLAARPNAPAPTGDLAALFNLEMDT